MAGQTGQRLCFIGVTASDSSITAVFPRWAAVLGLDGAWLDPIDLPLDAGRGDYRSVVEEIRDDPECPGALITTHKVRLREAAEDLFDELSDDAALLGEISSISKREGRMIGHAKDPVTAARALEELLSPTHFADTRSEVLCLGAGGAGLAISLYLRSRRAESDRPRRITLADPDEPRLDACRRLHDSLGADSVDLAYVAVDSAQRADGLLAALPAWSMVINATGLGKDRPGTPITDAAPFPVRGIAWDLNYRGDLEFLRQARAQAPARSLRLEDGWRYFIHGWSEVVSEVFGVPIDAATLAALSSEASGARPR